MWSVWRRCQQGSWTLAVRALQRRSRGMRRRTRAGRSAGMLAGEVLTPNISARRQAQQSTLRRPRDGLGMRGGSSRPLRTQPKCTSRRGHRHRRGASCRCAGAARAAKRPAVRSTRRPRPASCTRTLWGTSGWTRRSPQSCETGTGGAGRARGGDDTLSCCAAILHRPSDCTVGCALALRGAPAPGSCVRHFSPQTHGARASVRRAQPPRTHGYQKYGMLDASSLAWFTDHASLTQCTLCQ